MSTELLKYAFVAGELSPSLLGRTDLTKYDLAMAEAYNFFVDYRGGLSSRPGTEFIDFLPDYHQGTSGGTTLELIPAPFIFPMKIEADTEYNYMLVVSPINSGDTFDHSIIQFFQNGDYNYEPSFPVSDLTLANPLVVTSTGHNFANGDRVRFDQNINFPELAKTTFTVRNVSGDTYNLEFVSSGNLVNGLVDMADPGIPQGRIARIYSLECDYQPSEYADMRWEQHGDIVRITHRAHPIRNLTWYYDGSLAFLEDQYGKGWTLDDELIGIDAAGPTITSHTASETGSAEVVFAVTAVYDTEIESVRGPAYKLSSIVNYAATEGSVSINWTADPDARYYNIYRSIISVTETLTSGSELGFVGRSRGTKFTDPNIIPDFSRTPPKQHNPFAPNRIVGLHITNGGSGYTDFATSFSLTGSIGFGAGFHAEGVVNDSGKIVNAVVINEGHDYNVPPVSTLTITGGGTGATADVITCDDIGETYTYPGVSVVHQQRQLYASTYSLPVNLFGSQVGQFSNFDTTANVTDSDSFNFTLDTSFYAPIRHLVPTQAGLVAMTQEMIWLVNGGAPTDPITATNIVASPQNYSGAGIVRPIKVGGDILYTEGKGYAVRVLAYQEASRSFTADDRSILSSHLFGKGREIISWAYQEQPSKIVWAVRADGALLAFTMVKSEDIYGWTSGGTIGQFLAVAAMREATADASYQPDVLDVVDSVYFITQRYIGGAWRRCVERMAQRDFVNLEDAWCLDAAVKPKWNRPNGNVDISLEDNGNWKITSDSDHTFDSSVNIGDVLRAGGGVFKFLDTDTDWWEAEAIELPKSLIPGTNTVLPIGTQEWSLTTPYTVVRGLWHLEGETVSILADGKIVDSQVVSGGKITLVTAASNVVVGIPFTCRARSLPVTQQQAVIEGKRKRTVGLGVRVERTKGLKAGRTADELYDVERGGEPTVMKDGLYHELVSTSWDDDSSLTFVQDKPLPVTMLSLITDIEVGDDTN